MHLERPIVMLSNEGGNDDDYGGFCGKHHGKHHHLENESKSIEF